MTFISQKVKSSSSNLSNLDMVLNRAIGKIILAGDAVDDKLIVENDSNHKLLELSGNSTYQLGGGSVGSSGYFSMVTDGRMFMYKTADNFIELNATTGMNRFAFLNNGLEITTGSKDFVVNSTTTDFHFYQGTLQVGDTLQAPTGATNSILVENGTAPTANKTDRHWYYSSNDGSGFACATFRDENSNVVRLQLGAALSTLDTTVTDGTIATLELIANNNRLRLRELEDVMQLNGLLA